MNSQRQTLNQKLEDDEESKHGEELDSLELSDKDDKHIDDENFGVYLKNVNPSMIMNNNRIIGRS